MDQPWVDNTVLECDRDDRVEFLSDIERLAASSDYSEFRRLDSLGRCVSGVNRNGRGDRYFQFLNRQRPSLLASCRKLFRRLDRFGQPHLFEFADQNSRMQTSDSNLPPLFLYYHLTERFELPPNLRIAEIGCGFGINTAIFDHLLGGFRRYDHFDLPAMLAMQRSFVDRCGVSNARYLTPEQLDRADPEYDLLLSDFALTEIDHRSQCEYLDRLIVRCQRGIVLGNIEPSVSKRSNYLAGEFFDRLTAAGYRWWLVPNPVYKGQILTFERIERENL